jgi:hypothetical protein
MSAYDFKHLSFQIDIVLICNVYFVYFFDYILVLSHFFSAAKYRKYTRFSYFVVALVTRIRTSSTVTPCNGAIIGLVPETAWVYIPTVGCLGSSSIKLLSIFGYRQILVHVSHQSSSHHNITVYQVHQVTLRISNTDTVNILRPCVAPSSNRHSGKYTFLKTMCLI